MLITFAVISLTACKKKRIEPLEAKYHITVTSNGNEDGKIIKCEFDVSGVSFTHNATFNLQGHIYDTIVSAPWPPIVHYKVYDYVDNGHDYEPDNGGIVTITVWDQNGKRIITDKGSKELTNY